MNRASIIRKMTIGISLRLLIVVTALASLGISPLAPKTLSGGHSEAMAMLAPAPQNGGDAGAPERWRASGQTCGPTDTCVPVLLHQGNMVRALNLGPYREIDLPRLMVNLWYILPTAPIPIV